MHYKIPEDLYWWREEPGGEEWLQRLPGLLVDCERRWNIQVTLPIEPASVSYVAPAIQSDGSMAILKINFPEEESEREPDALSLWSDEVSVRLLSYHEPSRAMLLEYIEPGERLWMLPEDEAYQVSASLLRRLHQAPPIEHRFALLSDYAKRWADELPVRYEKLGRPFERRLIEEAVELINYFIASPRAKQVILHQDLHGGNILRARRAPWLIIDPKPLVGDPEFDAASMLRDRRPRLEEETNPLQIIQRRLDLLVDEVDFERERARGWGLIHALTWGMTESRFSPIMVACARWISQLR